MFSARMMSRSVMLNDVLSRAREDCLLTIPEGDFPVTLIREQYCENNED